MDQKKKRLLKRIGEYVSSDPQDLKTAIARQEQLESNGKHALIGKLLVDAGGCQVRHNALLLGGYRLVHQLFILFLQSCLGQ